MVADFLYSSAYDMASQIMHVKWKFLRR